MDKQNNVTREPQESQSAATNIQTTDTSTASLSAPNYQVSADTGAAGDDGDCDCYTHIIDVINQQVDDWGTDEDAIYDAIRSCPQRGRLKGDMYALQKLRSEMSGHDMWKAYLLIEFGDEANFPKEINDIWTATKGMGTDEDAIFDALRSMSEATRATFGLGYILQSELSGDDLTTAMNLMNARSTTGDSIQENIFGNGNTDGDYEFIINPENAVELIGVEFQGSGTKALKDAMIMLYDRPGGALLQEAIDSVAAARGIDAGTAMAQYLKAMQLRDEGIAYYRQKKEEHGHVYDPVVDHPSPKLSADNIDFTGTNAQLTFGKVVGDVFGIDAVFGSLISPTGGMAGPGNGRIPFTSDGSAVATHGAVHDAAGYLKNCHNIGDGYDYFNNEAGSDGTNPLAGQTNIRWWIEQYEAAGIDRGIVEGRAQNLMANQAYKGAAFAKDYSLLNLEQKKEVLGIICGVSWALLKILDLTSADREAKVQEIMDVSSDGDKNALADEYYNNDRFGSILSARALDNIMYPFVSNTVYLRFLARRSTGQ